MIGVCGELARVLLWARSSIQPLDTAHGYGVYLAADAHLEELHVGPRRCHASCTILGSDEV